MENQEKEKKENVSTEILSDREASQDIDITMEEIDGEKNKKANYRNDNNIVDDEKVKAGIDQINPDEGSMNSRG